MIITTATVPDHPVNTTAWLLIFAFVLPVLLTGVFGAPKSRPRRIARTVTWPTGVIACVYLAYRAGTLLPATITEPQPGTDLRGLLTVLFVSIAAVIGVVAAYVLIRMTDD